MRHTSLYCFGASNILNIGQKPSTLSPSVGFACCYPPPCLAISGRWNKQSCQNTPTRECDGKRKTSFPYTSSHHPHSKYRAGEDAAEGWLYRCRWTVRPTTVCASIYRLCFHGVFAMCRRPPGGSKTQLPHITHIFDE